VANPLQSPDSRLKIRDPVTLPGLAPDRHPFATLPFSFPLHFLRLMKLLRDCGGLLGWWEYSEVHFPQHFPSGGVAGGRCEKCDCLWHQTSDIGNAGERDTQEMASKWLYSPEFIKANKIQKENFRVIRRPIIKAL